MITCIYSDLKILLGILVSSMSFVAERTSKIPATGSISADWDGISAGFSPRALAL
jgi:hypothetical protein